MARAQAPFSGAASTTVNLNYVYAASLGFGGYSIGGLTTNVYTLPLFNTVHDFPADGWSLKMMLPVQAGLYHFSGDLAGRSITLNQQSIAVVPGAELQIPVANRLVVKPFAQFGAGYSFGPQVGNPGAWIYLAGVRSVAQWRAGDYTLSLGNGIVYAGDATIGPGPAENYLSLQLAGEIRRPLGFQVGGVKPDLGLFVANYYYPAPLRFSRFLRSELHVHDQMEIGLSLGSAEPMNILWLANPRIGAGYVFGGGLQVWHINFGFPF